MVTMLCFFLTNHLQAVVDLFMFHGHVVEVNKPESSFMRGVHSQPRIFIAFASLQRERIGCQIMV